MANTPKYVKVQIPGESFWIKPLNITTQAIVGYLANDLVTKPRFRFNDLVLWNARTQKLTRLSF